VEVAENGNAFVSVGGDEVDAVGFAEAPDAQAV
jgi:hypothetical protein